MCVKSGEGKWPAGEKFEFKQQYSAEHGTGPLMGTRSDKKIR